MKRLILLLTLPFALGLAQAQNTANPTDRQNRMHMQDGQGPHGPGGMHNDQDAREYQERMREERRDMHHQSRPYDGQGPQGRSGEFREDAEIRKHRERMLEERREMQRQQSPNSN